MDEVSRSCPSWCVTDHDEHFAHRSATALTVRVPQAGREAASAFLMLAGDDGDTRVVISGDPFTVEAARDHARSILRLLDRTRPAHAAGLAMVNDMLEMAGIELKLTEDDAATVDDLSRIARGLGRAAAEGQLPTQQG